MQKKYLIGGGVIALLFLGLFLFSSRGGSQGNNSQDVLTSVSSFSHSHGMAVDINDAEKVYIATHEGLFILSAENKLYQVGKTRDDLMGFSPHPTEAKTFFSSGHPLRGGNIGFQKTTDGGVTWTKVSDGLGGPVDFHGMAVSQVNPNIVYGSFGGKIQRTTDGGLSWNFTEGSVQAISLSSDPKNESVLYASTPNGVQISKNGGDTWEGMSPQLEGGAVSVFALDPQSSYALAFSQTLGGMGKSTDGGATWQKVQESFGSESVLYLAFSKSQQGTVYALTSGNSLYKSINGGDAWTKVR